MKLYIWKDPWQVPYGSSMIVAVAETEEQAREQVRTAPLYKYVEYKGSGAGWTDKLGEPLRVVDCPCAELHEWSE